MAGGEAGPRSTSARRIRRGVTCARFGARSGRKITPPKHQLSVDGDSRKTISTTTTTAPRSTPRIFSHYTTRVYCPSLDICPPILTALFLASCLATAGSERDCAATFTTCLAPDPRRHKGLPHSLCLPRLPLPDRHLRNQQHVRPSCRSPRRAGPAPAGPAEPRQRRESTG